MACHPCCLRKRRDSLSQFCRVRRSSQPPPEAFITTVCSGMHEVVRAACLVSRERLLAELRPLEASAGGVTSEVGQVGNSDGEDEGPAKVQRTAGSGSLGWAMLSVLEVVGGHLGTAHAIVHAGLPAQFIMALSTLFGSHGSASGHADAGDDAAAEKVAVKLVTVLCGLHQAAVGACLASLVREQALDELVSLASTQAAPFAQQVLTVVMSTTEVAPLLQAVEYLSHRAVVRRLVEQLSRCSLSRVMYPLGMLVCVMERAGSATPAFHEEFEHAHGSTALTSLGVRMASAIVGSQGRPAAPVPFEAFLDVVCSLACANALEAPQGGDSTGGSARHLRGRSDDAGSSGHPAGDDARSVASQGSAASTGRASLATPVRKTIFGRAFAMFGGGDEGADAATPGAAQEPPLPPSRRSVPHMRAHSHHRIVRLGSPHGSELGGGGGGGSGRERRRSRTSSLHIEVADEERGRVHSVPTAMVLHTLAMRLLRADLAPAGPGSSPAAPPPASAADEAAAAAAHGDASAAAGTETPAGDADTDTDADADTEGVAATVDGSAALQQVSTPVRRGGGAVVQVSADDPVLLSLQQAVMHRVASLFEAHVDNGPLLQVCVALGGYCLGSVYGRAADLFVVRLLSVAEPPLGGRVCIRAPVVPIDGCPVHPRRGISCLHSLLDSVAILQPESHVQHGPPRYSACGRDGAGADHGDSHRGPGHSPAGCAAGIWVGSPACWSPAALHAHRWARGVD